jgi:hypothetical protein
VAVMYAAFWGLGYLWMRYVLRKKAEDMPLPWTKQAYGLGLNYDDRYTYQPAPIVTLAGLCVGCGAAVTGLIITLIGCGVLSLFGVK